MLNNPTKLIFLMTLIASTLISTSANSWLGAWMGLEINLLSFIPLMTNNKNSMSNEASLKYFLIQALASTVLLFTIIMAALMFNTNNSFSIQSPFIVMLTNSSLLLKMGAAPFHFWFPSMIEGLSWANSLTLMTWQKIAPLMLLSYNLKMDLFITLIIALSIIMGSLGGLNQTSLRKILTYSSISHLGWLISAMLIGENMWTTYFLIYSFLLMTIIYMLNLYKISYINQIFSMNLLHPVTKFAMFITFLSLGGLPPFLGFLPKWLIIQSLMTNNMITLVTVMVIMTLLTLFYYLRTSFGAFTLSYSESIWTIQPTPTTPLNKMALTLTMISTLGLPLCMSLFNIL